jgi:hypothetical protein
MKRFALIAIALLVVSCGSKPPTQPSAGAPTFTATLLPANENPAIVAPENTGSGTVTITMNLTRDANQAITAATATFVVNLTGFPANTPINLAHIHEGDRTTNGPVRVNLGLANGEVVLTNGAGSFTKSNINVDVNIANALVNGNTAGFYFNVHSQINPGGVARGQLTKTQ